MEHIGKVIVRGVKEQKIVQNYKNSLLNSLSQEPYIIWLSFAVNKCKTMVSPCDFSFFQTFDFLGCYWGKKEKNSTPYLKSHTLNHCHPW